MDERGKPLAGAMVSALGSTSAVAVTDQHGVFVMRSLPAGAYMVRAHLTGFAPSRRQLVDVRATDVGALGHHAAACRVHRHACPVPGSITSQASAPASEGAGRGAGSD